jgi:enediyne biosynthesis protein E3
VTISLSKLRRSLLGVSHKEATSFSEGNSSTWKHLETAVLAAIEGYHSTLDGSKFEALVPRLNTVALELRGYAYEGAAMGLTGLDCLLPWKNRLRAYMAGPGEAHIYMVHIGAGEALARLRKKPEPFIARLEDRVLCWLVMDGYGFHEGFFSRHRYVDEQVVPAHLSSYARRIFDQGLGRSIWFSAGANVDRIAAIIAAFPQARQADLWVGIGVACTYVGGVDRAAIEALHRAAGPYGPQMALGAAVVAKGRQRAGNPVPHTDLACEVLCGVSSERAAHILDVAFQNLPTTGPEPAYEILQQRLLAQFAERTESVYQQKEAI